MSVILDIRPNGVTFRTESETLADNICRIPACACVHHSTLDMELLEAYGIDWRQPSVGQPRLTPTETRLLALLLPPGRLVTHGELLGRVWGPTYATSEGKEFEHANRHLLRVNVARLRMKLGPRWLLVALAGIGYRLTIPNGQHGL